MQVSRATIVVNGAIIVFREGLEAVLILAAITASFVGAKRRLRRPVLIGALAGLIATALTWVVAQELLHALGDGGLELQAVTGLVAIAVLLLVTNWFFHRVYWSEWISRFNRRRKALERFDRLGFVSGQMLGLMLLGISSVYREGLETVLFLQALQTSAGTGATALGAGIGLGATLIVGAVTFKLQRKLPFKRMLVLTGVLIALVLAVMVGTTVHNMQGIGWLASTTTSFEVPVDWSTWLGVYPTWQGIGAQLGALVFVFGSYFAARELQIGRPRRRARRALRLANGAAQAPRQDDRAWRCLDAPPDTCRCLGRARSPAARRRSRCSSCCSRSSSSRQQAARRRPAVAHRSRCTSHRAAATRRAAGRR